VAYVMFESDHVSLSVTARTVLTSGASDPAPFSTVDRMRVRMPWRLGRPAIETLPLSTLPLRNRFLEVCGVTDAGALGWALLRLFSPDNCVVARQQVGGRSPYLCAAVFMPGVVAGVQAGGVSWFRMDEHRATPVGQARADLRDAVACFACTPAEELIVVCRDGGVARFSLPG